MIKVLIIDDSFIIRQSISYILKLNPIFNTLTARNYEDAIKKVNEYKPDVVITNVQIQGVSGLDIIYSISQIKPTPSILMSKNKEIGMHDALIGFKYGVYDFILLPENNTKISELKDKIINLVNNAASIEINKFILKKPAPIINVPKSSNKVVVIGASTGGPQTVELILSSFPKNFPSPILVVQHMALGFTEVFAKRLSKKSQLNVKEAKNGDELKPGQVLVAPGGTNIQVEKNKNKLNIKLSFEESSIKPSIDIVLKSISKEAGENVIVVILTGIGRDGSEGVKIVKNNKGKIICQDKSTSLVFKMPKAIIDEGNADFVLSLEEIPKKIVDLL